MGGVEWVVDPSFVYDSTLLKLKHSHPQTTYSEMVHKIPLAFYNYTLNPKKVETKDNTSGTERARLIKLKLLNKITFFSP